MNEHEANGKCQAMCYKHIKLKTLFTAEDTESTESTEVIFVSSEAGG